MILLFGLIQDFSSNRGIYLASHKDKLGKFREHRLRGK